MEKSVDLQAVKGALRALEDQGEKVTARKVLTLTGGSMTTVLRLLREAQTARGLEAQTLQNSLPQPVVQALLAFAGAEVAAASNILKADLESERARGLETLEALELAEARITALQGDLMASLRETDEARKEAEKAAAAWGREIEGLQRQVAELETERRQLIEAGEAARTSAAKADMKVERADQATAKAESWATELATRMAALQEEKTALEKSLAAAEQHAAVAGQRYQDLFDQAKRADCAAQAHLAEIRSAAEKEAAALRERIQAADLATAKAEARAERTEAELEKMRKNLNGTRT